MNLKKEAKEIFLKAIESVKPKNIIKNAISFEGNNLKIFDKTFTLKDGKFYLFGSGKASIESAKAFEEIAKERIKEGFVISNYKEELQKVEVFKSSHPIPSKESVEAADMMIKHLKKLQDDDFFIYLLSGGSSALMEKPIHPITLEEFQETTKLLLLNGATIHEINCIRKHLSLVKGGRLASLTKVKGIVLVISDVIGDDLETIASAPFYFDKSTYKNAYEILKRYSLLSKIPNSVKSVIEKGINKKIKETPKKEKKEIKHFLIANNKTALLAAKKEAIKRGFKIEIVTDSLQGDVKDVSLFLLQKARESPNSILFGGETTVLVKGKGKGGRNQELALRVLKEMKKEDDFAFLSGGTDGIDGNSPAAGAVVDFSTKEKALKLGLNIDDFLKNNDSYSFFKKLGEVIETSPTGTNVMDICIIFKGE